MSELYYTLSTHTAEQFDEVHTELTTGSLLGRNVVCENHTDHSPTRGEFLLTEEEATTVKSDARIKFINLTPSRYPEIYNATEDDLRMDVRGVDYSRYANGTTVKNWQFWANSGSILGSFTEDTPADVGRASNQLLRCKQKRNPWISGGLGNTDYIDANPTAQGAGENVDIICMDNGTWIGHVEFINPNRVPFDAGATISPRDYVGGNVLPGEGYCDVLDVVLDAPYYIDPDWFNADAATRLETRWDGTIVPTETAAHNWWRNSTQRSAQFAEFGNISTNTGYTRDRCHGSNSTYPTSASADHGTQCASLIYGRTHGWAYNANKWHLNLYSNNNVGSFEIGFDVCKIFHQYKPINSLYGAKDPTIGSNSWGFRADKGDNYYWFQNAANGVSYSQFDEPEFMRYMGVDGDNGRWKSEMLDNSMTEAGKELVDSGFIFVVAAGNSGQMQTNPDDPNYDNHISGSPNTADVYLDTYFEFGYEVSGTINRRGFPQHIGKTESQTTQGNTTVKFPAINIGALDDAFASGPKERKVTYSDMGNAIDLYAPADGTLAATVGTFGTDVARFDDSYVGLSTSFDCRDTRFSGTSAACPVAAGFLATVLQYNRGWTYEDLRSWIQDSVEIQDSADFYDDARGTTAEGSEWSDRNRLQGGDARVAYLAPYTISTPYPIGDPVRILRGSLNLRGPISIRFRNR
jgi:hypothetical protein